ncbi:MAG: hypothetical protein RR052_06625 [Oscillospiraceae bacterium]
MNNCTRIHEFKDEAKNALFNRQQAVSIIKHLLKLESEDTGNHNEKDCAILAKAAEKICFEYLDATTTRTDEMLDAYGVARITVADITLAIDNVLFDVK